MLRSLSCFVFMATIFAGCVSIQDDVKTKASFDLDCPKEKLMLKETGDAGFGVEGCGKRARYQCSANVGCYKNSETTSK
jgi:hypothetical protein